MKTLPNSALPAHTQLPLDAGHIVTYNSPSSDRQAQERIYPPVSTPFFLQVSKTSQFPLLLWTTREFWAVDYVTTGHKTKLQSTDPLKGVLPTAVNKNTCGHVHSQMPKLEPVNGRMNKDSYTHT